MIDQPSVDVIVPAKDAGDAIRPALEAVNNQTYRDLGSVVVAASDSATAAVAKGCGAVVVDNPTGRTPTGLNLALARTTAEVIARRLAVEGESTDAVHDPYHVRNWRAT